MATKHYEGWQIKTGFLAGNLFDGQETDGVNEEASAQRYREMLTADLEAVFPGAEVTVVQEEGVGSEPRSCRAQAYSPLTSDVTLGEEQAAEDRIVAISNDLWMNGEWIIDA